MFMTCMVKFAHFAGQIWDQVFSANASKSGASEETIIVLDARIRHWCDSVLPTIPLLPPEGVPTDRHRRQLLNVKTVRDLLAMNRVTLSFLQRMAHLRLLLHRRVMVSLLYDANTGRLCGNLAIDIVQQIKQHSVEIHQPSSWRFHFATALGGAILILSTLLCRHLAEIGLDNMHSAYAASFNEGVTMLKDLAATINAARRIEEDLKDIVHVVTSLLNQPMTIPQADFTTLLPQNMDNIFPYGAIDFAQSQWHQEGFSDNGEGPASVTTDLLGGDTMRSLDPWENELQNAQGYGAPWI